MRNDSLLWKEQHLYGSSRLGIWYPDTAVSEENRLKLNGLIGRRHYELSNHLGNVMAVISDKKVVEDAQSYYPEMIDVYDYYAFGAPRDFTKIDSILAGSRGYRYGFNGKENDNEVKGNGNQQDYGMRIYDPRLGRFLSVDPISSSFPWYTPYQFAGNAPIAAIDVEGAEPFWGPGNFIWEAYFYTKLSFQYGDPTGVKQLTTGLSNSHKVQTGQMTYHNNNVPLHIQEKLDRTTELNARLDITTGGAKIISFNVEASLEGASLVFPLEGAVINSYKGLRTIGAVSRFERGLVNQFGVGSRFERALSSSLQKLSDIGKGVDADAWMLIKAEEVAAKGGTTTVYRNFGWNEYKALRASGNNFEIGSNFGSKQFWLDKEGINWWNSTSFSKNFTAKITVNNSALKQGTNFLDAGKYRAISFDSQEALNIFNKNMKIEWIQYK